MSSDVGWHRTEGADTVTKKEEKKKKKSPKIADLPCFLFRADVFTHSKSPGRLLSVLSCVYLALYSQYICLCVRVLLRVHALRIVSRDRFCALKLLLLYG